LYCKSFMVCQQSMMTSIISDSSFNFFLLTLSKNSSQTTVRSSSPPYHIKKLSHLLMQKPSSNHPQDNNRWRVFYKQISPQSSNSLKKYHLRRKELQRSHCISAYCSFGENYTMREC
jgi:hypothetical protein